MIITTKSDIEKVIEYMKSASKQEEDYKQRAALINVAWTLEQAIESHQEDINHPHLYLEIVKAPNIMDCAMSNCCTTDCVHVCKGTCPFTTDEDKYRCPRISHYLDV